MTGLRRVAGQTHLVLVEAVDLDLLRSAVSDERIDDAQPDEGS
jgi:RNase P/RNase MRP subunit p30